MYCDDPSVIASDSFDAAALVQPNALLVVTMVYADNSSKPVTWFDPTA